MPNLRSEGDAANLERSCLLVPGERKRSESGKQKLDGFTLGTGRCRAAEWAGECNHSLSTLVFLSAYRAFRVSPWVYYLAPSETPSRRKPPQPRRRRQNSSPKF